MNQQKKIMKKAFLFMGILAAAAFTGGISAWAVAGRGAGTGVQYIEREVERTPALGTHFTTYDAG
ncbi:MAG: serine protease MucD, partial [Alistipes sp.]|nr:serine protease MucD [Alistipes sp.]